MYSRNRTFRILLSAKYGQARPFVLANPDAPPPTYADFARSLITNVPFDAQLRLLGDNISTGVGVDDGVASLSGARRAVPLRAPSMARLHVPGASTPGSPFPNLDAYILQVVNDPVYGLSHPAFIRSVDYFVQGTCARAVPCAVRF